MNVKPRFRLLVVALITLVASPLDAQVAANDYTGAESLGLTLRRMATTARVLMIGAHPDDENTAVLATLALGEGADVAYLSLTRGDGGQNLIGPELKEGLGLIRTDELLAARRIDGARQFFARAYDYGYSKSADEAFRHWPRDSVTADVVAVIREFRPDVILSVWSGTPADGHGQHEASGIVAKDAFEAAADPARFAGQIAAGLEPHRARHLLQSTWRPSGEPVFWIATGEYDPLLGRSHFQISMASRSQHRSQDQGSAQPAGPQRTAVVALGGSRPASLFADVPTTLAGHARAVGAPASLLSVLEAWQDNVEQATTSFNPLRPDALVTPLSAAFESLAEASSLARAAGLRELAFRVDAERDDAAAALRLAAGIVLVAEAEDDIVVPGQTFEVTLGVWNGGTSTVSIESLAPALPDGWRMATVIDGVAAVRPGELVSRRFGVIVPARPGFSDPYFLEAPRQGDMYSWPADFAVRGRPYEAPPVQAEARVRIGSTVLPIATEARFLQVDKALGERRLSVLVVPAAAVRVEPGIAVVPLAASTDDGDAPPARDVTVTVTGEAAGGIAGEVRIEAPAGWAVSPESLPVRIAAEGERQSLRFTVSPPAGLAAGKYRVGAVFEDGDGALYRRGWTRIDYPHTQPRLLFGDAAATFSVFPVALADGLRVGFIEGAGDDAAAALTQMGAQVEPLSPAMLRSGDLARFDVIVAGIRAYEVRPDIIEANARLLDWVEAGGTYVVQYNKQEFVRGGFAPYPLEMRQSADRVTDEASPVRIVAAEHPAMNWPNLIGPSDFEDWVQERGLYFPSGWDERWTPLLEMNDPGESPQPGSLLVTTHGRGTYVYTGLSFFRQLPEGVPGAYRILANLVSLGGR
jgi:LmbE family N-acetylglucosaminyl deacetylase